jgi:hypothetical protein
MRESKVERNGESDVTDTGWNFDAAVHFPLNEHTPKVSFLDDSSREIQILAIHLDYCIN